MLFCLAFSTGTAGQSDNVKLAVGTARLISPFRQQQRESSHLFTYPQYAASNITIGLANLPLTFSTKTYLLLFYFLNSEKPNRKIH